MVSLIYKNIKKKINYKSILFCTTTGYFLPFSSSLQKKNREEEKKNEVGKPVLNYFFFRIDLESTKICILDIHIYNDETFVFPI